MLRPTKQTGKNKKEAAFKSSGKKSNERKKISAPTKRLDWGQSHQSTTLRSRPLKLTINQLIKKQT